MADQSTASNVAVPIPSKIQKAATSVVKGIEDGVTKIEAIADADLKDAVHAAETIATGWWQKIKTKAGGWLKYWPFALAAIAMVFVFLGANERSAERADYLAKITASDAAVSSLAVRVSKLASATPSRSDVAEANARIDDLKNQVATLKDQVEKLAKAPSRLSKTKQRR